MLDAMECPPCGHEFTPRRTNQQYCSDPCRKNATRGDRKTENKDRTSHHFERSQRLTEMLYSTPPASRDDEMKRILGYVPLDGGLRNLLTDPVLLRETPRVDGRDNIAKAANRYTKLNHGISITTYVRKARHGHEVPEVDPEQLVDHGPVPNLRQRLTTRNVKCWHKPLPEGPLEIVETMRDTAQTTRDVDPEVSDRLHLMADLKQSGEVTQDDYDRIEEIVAKSLQPRASTATTSKRIEASRYREGTTIAKAICGLTGEVLAETEGSDSNLRSFRHAWTGTDHVSVEVEKVARAA